MNGQQEVVVQRLKLSLAFFVPEFGRPVWKRPRVDFPQRFLLKGAHVMRPHCVDDKITKLQAHVADIHDPGDGAVVDSHLKILSEAHAALVGAIKLVINNELP